VLYAQDGFDQSYLHNPLMHQLSRDTGRYSSRTRFAEMFLNTSGGNGHLQLAGRPELLRAHTVEEKIKRGPNRVDIVELKPQATTARPLPAVTCLRLTAQIPMKPLFTMPTSRAACLCGPAGPRDGGRVAGGAATTFSYFSQFGAALWGATYNPVTGYARLYRLSLRGWTIISETPSLERHALGLEVIL